jgi:prolyl-tRNA synthetase
VVIVPVYRTEEELNTISEKVAGIKKELEKAGLSVKFDNRDTQKPGFKFAEWELKGVPVRIAIGPRDLQNNAAEVARRDTKTKEVIGMDNLVNHVTSLMDEIQQNLFNRAGELRAGKTWEANNWEEFVDIVENRNGFALAHWDGTGETEEKIKDLTKATIRCIPLDAAEEAGNCILTGKPSNRRVVFAKAY